LAAMFIRSSFGTFWHNQYQKSKLDHFNAILNCNCD